MKNLYRKSISEIPINYLKRRNSICGPCNNTFDHISHNDHSNLLFRAPPKSNTRHVSDHDSVNSIIAPSSVDFLHHIQNDHTQLHHHNSIAIENLHLFDGIHNQKPTFKKSHARQHSLTNKLENIFLPNQNKKNLKSSSNNNNNNNNNNSNSPRRYSLDINQIKEMNKEFNKSNDHHYLTTTPKFNPIDTKSTTPNIDISSNDDSESIFQSAWSKLIKTVGVENLEFPSEITFLIGAPGAGKDTNTSYIRSRLGIDSKPIVVSSLLNSKECQEIKSAGGLVDDKLVFEMLLKEITKPDFSRETSRKSIIVDGFPRSRKQARLVELLYDKLCWVKKELNPNSLNKPVFRISVLHVSEEESVKRQLYRGKCTIEENVARSQNQQPLLEIRDTDVNPEASKKRYKVYSEQYDALKTLGDKFKLDEIDANGSRDDVKFKIEQIYQPNLVSTTNNQQTSNFAIASA